MFFFAEPIHYIENIGQVGKDAEIDKKVCYHMSRHTFATMELTMGADLYTTSLLMGHSNVQITQIYARIIDKKKEQAVMMIDALFDEPLK